MTSMKTHETLIECTGDNPYGYGLRLHLDAAQCKALGIDQPPPVGTRFAIRAEAYVARGEQEAPGEDDKPVTRVSLQITDLDLSRTSSAEDAARVLYPEGGAS